MSQVDLPFDAILEILSLLDNDRSCDDGSLLHTKNIFQPALFSVCLVSRQWNEAGTRFLYNDVVLAGERALSVFLMTLQNNEDLRPHVRSVFFTRAFSVEEVEDWPNFEKCEELDMVYSMCPRIHFRRVNVAEPANNTSAHGECSGWESLDFRTLTRLDLQTSGCVPDTFSPELLLPALEDLIIRGWKVVSGRKKLPRWPVMPRLWRLCLIDCEFQVATECLPDLPPEHRGLRVLEIVGGTYLGYGLMSSIRRRGHSLEFITFLPFSNSESYVGPRLVTTLRISTDSLVHYNAFHHLPPDLVHLTYIRTEYSQRLGDTRYIITRLFEHRRERMHPQWTTIQFSDKLTLWSQALYDEVSKLFVDAGVKFVLTEAVVSYRGKGVQ